VRARASQPSEAGYVRRYVLTIMIFLLVGAVVNVGVAWGLGGEWKRNRSVLPLIPPPLNSVRKDSPFLPPLNSVREDSPWPRNVPTHWPDTAERVYVYRAKSFGMSRLKYVADRRLAPHPLFSNPKLRDMGRESFELELHLAGWPMPGLAFETWEEVILEPRSPESMRRRRTRPTEGHPPQSNWWARGIPIDAIQGSLRLPAYKPLPIRPCWPGFAVNTLFYAAILWLLIPGPFALRRLIRRRRGLCPRCAYPVGASSTCSECGRPLPQRGVPSQALQHTVRPSRGGPCSTPQ
jgi:hypothetical protein